MQCEAGTPPYDLGTFDLAELPREIDTATERWDWNAGAIACRFTPAEARDIMWERAKAYRVERQAMPVSIPDVVQGATVVADADPESSAIVDRLARGALTAIMMQAPFALTFTDHTNQQFTVDATQTVEIANAVLRYQSLCHGASQAIREALDAALASGATADDIFAIDITAGYPEPTGPGDPPEEH